MGGPVSISEVLLGSSSKFVSRIVRVEGRKSKDVTPSSSSTLSSSSLPESSFGDERMERASCIPGENTSCGVALNGRGVNPPAVPAYQRHDRIVAAKRQGTGTQSSANENRQE